MLALRLARGAEAPALCRWLLLAAAAGAVGFLLLASLAYAGAHPEDSRSATLRLAWCALPLAATVGLAMSVARADPAARPRAGLDAAGIGPTRLPLLAASSAVVAALLGSALALPVFLHLRGDLTALPLNGAASGLLSGGSPLPVPAALTLLALAPLASAAAATVSLRLRPGPEAAAGTGQDEGRVPTGLPWGTALITAGIALGAHAGRGTPPAGGAVPLPGAMGEITPGVVGAWLLTAAGILLAAPGIARLCGRLLSAGRPSALRLLSGRVLEAETHRLGRPMGALCVASATVLATLRADGQQMLGPLSVLGAVVIIGCAAAAIATAAAESRAAREHTTRALLGLGASRSLLRRAAVLRSAVLLAAFAPLTWVAAHLVVLPLGG
ncbi:hypothetical protein GCM10009716_05730 [Streptomyces sodiiphilus]|uniref:Integral membrane protein n=1 Tax=Streptomyces sodiiphilus TaxID=226217 RepID=A0ABN2NTE3_9ACTN